MAGLVNTNSFHNGFHLQRPQTRSRHQSGQEALQGPSYNSHARYQRQRRVVLGPPLAHSRRQRGQAQVLPLRLSLLRLQPFSNRFQASQTWHMSQFQQLLVAFTVSYFHRVLPLQQRQKENLLLHLSQSRPGRSTFCVVM